MKTIVALVDFSDVTPPVVDHALALARQSGGEIFLVHVIQPMPIVTEYPATVVASEVEESEARLAQLQALQDSLKKQHAHVSTRLLKGPVVDTLLDHLPALNPNLIVMGSHGHGALYNLLIGSVTQGVIKHAAWPVTVIPKVRTLKPQTETSAGSKKAKAESKPPLVGALGGAMLPP